MAQIVTTVRRFIGTAAERAAMTEADRNATPAGSTYLESDTGLLYVLDNETPRVWQAKVTNVEGDVDVDLIEIGGVAVSATAGVLDVSAQLTGSKAEEASAQETELATTVETYTRAAGASQIEVYCESGYVRVRTDGDPCTDVTGEPLAPGFGAAWVVPSISVYYIQESVITVVSR